MRVTLGLIVLGIGVVGGVLHATGKSEKSLIALIVVPTILLICLVLFHSLTVRVSRKELAFAFGPGVIRKTIPLSDIESAAAVRNHWYNGWGIKKIRGGWLYNVSGFDAVELQRKGGRKTRIGTDQPKKLLAAINAALESRRDDGA